jgi:hypothetical protein
VLVASALLRVVGTRQRWPCNRCPGSAVGGHLIADLQTYDGTDSAALRYRNLSSSAVDMRVEEEQSRDTETNHTTEVLGYLVVDGEQLI